MATAPQRRLSPKTIGLYTKAATKLAAWLEDNGHSTSVGEVGRSQIEGYVSWLLGRVSDSTANQEYRSLQQFFRWMFEEGDIDANPFDRMRPPRTEEKEVAVVSPEDLPALLRACESAGFEERRDKALFTMLVDTGARLAEIAGRRLADIDWDLGVAVVVARESANGPCPCPRRRSRSWTVTCSRPAAATPTPILSGCGWGNGAG